MAKRSDDVVAVIGVILALGGGAFATAWVSLLPALGLFWLCGWLK